MAAVPWWSCSPRLPVLLLKWFLTQTCSGFVQQGWADLLLQSWLGYADRAGQCVSSFSLSHIPALFTSCEVRRRQEISWLKLTWMGSLKTDSSPSKSLPLSWKETAQKVMGEQLHLSQPAGLSWVKNNSLLVISCVCGFFWIWALSNIVLIVS